MLKTALLSLCLAVPAFAADKFSAPQLIELAGSNSPQLQEAIQSSFRQKICKAGQRGPDMGLISFLQCGRLRNRLL